MFNERSQEQRQPCVIIALILHDWFICEVSTAASRLLWVAGTIPETGFTLHSVVWVSSLGFCGCVAFTGSSKHFRPAGSIGVGQFHQTAKSTQNFASNEAENVPNGPHLLKFTIFTSNLHESFMSSSQSRSVHTGDACSSTWRVPTRRSNNSEEQLLPWL